MLTMECRVWTRATESNLCPNCLPIETSCHSPTADKNTQTPTKAETVALRSYFEERNDGRRTMGSVRLRNRAMSYARHAEYKNTGSQRRGEETRLLGV